MTDSLMDYRGFELSTINRGSGPWGPLVNWGGGFAGGGRHECGMNWLCQFDAGGECILYCTICQSCIIHRVNVPAVSFVSSLMDTYCTEI
jgi:hypothetical protein